MSERRSRRMLLLDTSMKVLYPSILVLALYFVFAGHNRPGGGFVGGLVGAILGSGAVPVLGTLLGGLVGAFGGAVLGEYLRDQQLEPSLRIGVHATVVSCWPPRSNSGCRWPARSS